MMVLLDGDKAALMQMVEKGSGFGSLSIPSTRRAAVSKLEVMSINVSDG
jgi:hypothetical protein